MNNDSKDISKKCRTELKTLKPRKHKQLDFFVADLVSVTSFRDDALSMEHPIFALKAGDTKDVEYTNNDVKITIQPTSAGRATIFDKDLWIFCISKLMQAIYENEPVINKIRFTAYDFFITTNREIGGNTYKQLELALRRLAGTQITIQSQKEKNYDSKGFGLIEEWHIEATQKKTEIVDMIEVTLPNWLYESVINANVLKISENYFRIRKAIDRRVYELARKHCGNKQTFIIGLDKLYLKSGSKQDLRRFRADFKKLVVQCTKAEIDWNNLESELQISSNDFRFPDYIISYDCNKDQVIFTNKNFADNENLAQTRKNLSNKRDRQVKSGDLVRTIEKVVDKNGKLSVKIGYKPAKT